MKLKTILALAGVFVVSASVIVIVQQSRRPEQKIALPKGTENGLPTAISNYSKAFKLNTNLPLWTMPTDGRTATN